MPRPFSPYIYADEAACVEGLLRALPWQGAEIEVRAKDIVGRIRSRKTPPGQMEAFLRQYSLTTEEGLALMGLAEALLRIPDKKTAGALINDKIRAANWTGKGGADWVVKAAGMGLLMTRRTLDSALGRIGEPFIREAIVKTLRVMGGQFVLGEDIIEAVKNAAPLEKKGFRISYDILGEGARTAADAERYFRSYAEAIEYVGSRATDKTKRPGVSVKLSALHPRYTELQRERCVPEMIERLRELAKLAAKYDLPMIVDAEEVDRLEISLDIIEEVFNYGILSGWEGLGLAVQAYQKRALPLTEYLVHLAKNAGRKLQVRLVKGAYWDTEVKRAQVAGLADYPVFTRKTNTDVSYLACAHKLLNAGGYVYPLFGTHNAHTAAAIIEMASGTPFEFQHLFGMGGPIADVLLESGASSGIYAPVGPHEELLAYLVRRLLENGANTSFVNHLLNPSEPVENLVRDPVGIVRSSAEIRHPRIALPADIYKNEGAGPRVNSGGMDLTDPLETGPLLQRISGFTREWSAPSLIGGEFYKDAASDEIRNPADRNDRVGRAWHGNKGLIDKAFRIAGGAFSEWSNTPPEKRAGALERYADLLEQNRAEMMALCIREAGKTIPDALAEVREAVDFCRYYANCARHDFADHELPGPTGESNVLRLQGRGVFACISPWNFPLAIFTGQVAAALVAGNCVIAKPAEQTPLIAFRAVQLMHEAGIPHDVVHLIPGDGRVGASLVAHPDVAGVAFTGSTSVAREINMTLSDRRGSIVPFIAETGGQNAMIVDSSALPEQVVDDVVLSAFGSAGQRCSSLRVLFLQEEVADKIIRLLQGAMAELTIGNPALLSSDIGPVIDDEALAGLVRHRENLKGFGRLIHEVKLDPAVAGQGHFFAPCAYEIDNMSALKEEVFGPVLHVIRYGRKEIDDVLAQINGTGYGLTCGVHSRIDSFQEDIANRIRAGNAYVNRSMIGAVVGTQPFGGQGMSGTGPKAGGPHYLPRFATEKVISINTAAAGGNATLVSMGE
ncbi:MAG: bifunctional proline dehydrogenase/L-glutamate gamma-semialdehyde dehydrogenase PutA [Alphaproteobacteria bacterium]|nr:bifunctional proline dehydrogenase/L-glutamate gamma-semialdehyde dehydrogenase PutA [Alphaproteobacteria bacterium]